MTTRIKIKAIRPAGSVAGPGGQASPAPLLSFGTGTAGCHRSWLWMTRLGEAGFLIRMQSAILYDFNQETVDGVSERAKKLKGNPGTTILLRSLYGKRTAFSEIPISSGSTTV